MTGEPAPPAQIRRGNRTSVSLALGPFARPVLSRTISILAARADLPLDRLNDAVLVGDALVAHAADHVPDGRIVLAIDTNPRVLDLRMGPLRPGAGRRLLSSATLPNAGNVIERLVDEVGIRSSSAGGEYLHLRIVYAS